MVGTDMFEVAKLEFSRWIEKLDISKLSSYEKTMIGIIIEKIKGTI